MQNNFSLEEIEALKTSVVKGIHNNNKALWIRAFEYYNSHNKPKSMNCRPCYAKVLQFILNNQ